MLGTRYLTCNSTLRNKKWILRIDWIIISQFYLRLFSYRTNYYTKISNLFFCLAPLCWKLLFWFLTSQWSRKRLLYVYFIFIICFSIWTHKWCKKNIFLFEKLGIVVNKYERIKYILNYILKELNMQRLVNCQKG